MTDEERALLGALEDARPDDAEVARLRRVLAARADRDGLLDVAVDVRDSPLGPLLVAATGQGLVRVAFEREDHDRVLDALAAAISPRVLTAPARLATAARQLDEYFAGRRHRFDLPLDRTLSHGFRGAVQGLLPGIPYGSTRTYREVAELAGRAAAVRAVGTACATNPLPIVVPCHRVLRSDGALGGYVGGLPAKSALLALERAHRG